jgi:hypothetical protein
VDRHPGSGGQLLDRDGICHQEFLHGTSDMARWHGGRTPGPVAGIICRQKRAGQMLGGAGPQGIAKQAAQAGQGARGTRARGPAVFRRLRRTACRAGFTGGENATLRLPARVLLGARSAVNVTVTPSAVSLALE